MIIVVETRTNASTIFVALRRLRILLSHAHSPTNTLTRALTNLCTQASAQQTTAAATPNANARAHQQVGSNECDITSLNVTKHSHF